MPWSRDPGRYRGVPRAQAERIRRRDNRTCQKCGATNAFEVDHIENVSTGGADHDDNLQVLCRDCHQEKIQAEAAVGRAKRARHRDPEEHPGRLPRRH